MFQSKILDAYVSRTEKLDELIARMYVHGMSTRDIEATFADVLSSTGVSKSVVSRVTRCLSEDFEAFRKRDLHVIAAGLVGGSRNSFGFAIVVSEERSTEPPTSRAVKICSS